MRCTNLTLTCLLLTGCVLAAAPARAEICALDDPPAATLLLPYFEVDLAHPDGVTTLFALNNAAASATLVNVVLWTDLGVPTLSIPVYLTGYDVQTINLRDVFQGALPQTASAGQDAGDTISPHPDGSPAGRDVDFASCAGMLPPAPLDAAAVADLRAAHSGKLSTRLGGCAALDRGDGHVRGYVTADTVSSCSATVRTPADAGYFGAPDTARATDTNVLWGDFFLVDPAHDHAEGEVLTRIEAAAGHFHTGDLTFYGRFVGYSGADDREPLATTWGTRFVAGGPFTGGSDVIAWRDPQAAATPFACGGRGPTWFPLSQRQMVVFDEQEHASVPSPCPFECPPTLVPTPLPAVANRVHVGGAELPVPFDFGWIDFDLKLGASGVEWNPGDPVRSQSWVITLMSAAGRYGVGFSAAPLDSACAPRTCDPGYVTCP